MVTSTGHTVGKASGDIIRAHGVLIAVSMSPFLQELPAGALPGRQGQV